MDERILSGTLGCKLDDDDGDTLSSDEVTRHRRSRANFLAQYRMDVAFATKGATRGLTAPNRDDWDKLVRLGRYLVRYTRVVNWFKHQKRSDQVAACIDSDWAREERGDRRKVEVREQDRPWWRSV